MLLLELLGIALLAIITYGIVYGLIVACFGVLAIHLLKALALPLICLGIYYLAHRFDVHHANKHETNDPKQLPPNHHHHSE